MVNRPRPEDARAKALPGLTARYYILTNSNVFGNGPFIVKQEIDNTEPNLQERIDNLVGNPPVGLGYFDTIDEARAAMDALKEHGNGEGRP